MEEDFYSVDEAARILRLTPGRIRQMLRAGDLEGIPPEEGGGYREGLVLSPPAEFYVGIRPPCVSFLLFRRGLLSSPGARWLLRACDCLRRRCYAKPGPRKALSL